MRFFYYEQLLYGNPCVLKVDRYRLLLTTEFRLKLYKLWRENKNDEIGNELEKNGLGPGATGNGYLTTLLMSFRNSGYKGYAKGYRQISMMMETVTGQAMSEHRDLYLMRKYGMRTNIRRPSKNRKAMKELMQRNGKENLLMRRFKLHRPNEVRLTDVTYLDYGDGLRAYGSASIDPVTSRLICFVISENNDLQLALDTLKAMDGMSRGFSFYRLL